MENIATNRDKIYLSALLHDIGKFYQRADSGAIDSSKCLSQTTKDSIAYMCPLNIQKEYTHKHALWTAQFIEDYESVFKNLSNKSENAPCAKGDTFWELAAAHHLSDSQLSDSAKIIRRADHLSSGMDRDNEESMRDDQDERQWDSFRKKRMISILEGIGKPNHTHTRHLPLMPVSLKKAMFPQTHFDSDPDYEALWKAFTSEFKLIQSDTFRAFAETLLSLLQKYTATIPSSTINLPDVSLYDHSKTTAAIATCLYDKQCESTSDAPFLLIGADFSGIQNYIYNIISDGAAKNLKGRSFYLKLLSDSIVQVLLSELDLYDANVIYNSGGGFFILAPNTEQVRSKLELCRKEIEQKVLEAHGVDLYVALDSIEMDEQVLMGQNNKSLKETWKQLFDKRDLQKQHRYASMLQQKYDLFFEPGETGGTTPRDAITGEELRLEDLHAYTTDGKQLKLKAGIGFDEPVLRPLTWKQIELGRKLKKSDTWVISQGRLPYWNDKEMIEPAGLGICYYLLSQKDIIDKAKELKGSADKVRVITVNANQNDEINFLSNGIQGYNNIFSFDFYGGNDYPVDDNNSIKTFDELARADVDFKRLGILRMDVDNLGKVFQQGFSDRRNTLSRYAALSRNFDWFFRGYLNTLWRNLAKNETYILYSGGDDLFIVGRWDKALALAEKIREDFRLYTCNNPMLSVSGGVAIVGGKYPIKKGAEASEAEEKRAKGYESESCKKNAISFLGMPLCWDVEYPIVKQIKDELIAALYKSNSDFNKSFLSKLATHYENAKIENKSIKNLRTIWLMAYDFGRLKGRVKSAEIKELIDTCQKDVFVGNTLKGNKIDSPHHALELWYLAARWAELEIRTNLKNL